MITGVRLTQLLNGDPLLGASYNYKKLFGLEAIEKRLEDLFYQAKYLEFNFIIDTVKLQSDANGSLSFIDYKYGDTTWTFNRRMELYQQHTALTNLQLLLEVEFPTVILDGTNGTSENPDGTDGNIERYSDYFVSLVQQYSWVKYWQIMVQPEEKDANGLYKAKPDVYIKFLSRIYTKSKTLFPDIKIGGPGIYQALIDYCSEDPINNLTEGWLYNAVGKNSINVVDSFTNQSTIVVPQKDSSTNKITYVPGDIGFLPYIDFFSIQGKQDTQGLNYTIFGNIIDKINNMLQSKLGKKLPIFSIYQGWSSDKNNDNQLKKQGYYELREILNCIKNGVMPFKHQLVDEYFDSIYLSTVENLNTINYGYGLLYYDLTSKPAFQEYLFLLKNLKNFNTKINNNEVCNNDINVDSVTLINDEQSMKATIIWLKEYNSTNTNKNVILNSHYARKYLISPPAPNTPTNLIPTSELTLLSESVSLDFSYYNFVIVFETVQDYKIDLDELNQQITSRLNYTQTTLENLIRLLPTSLNKEVKDTNYYKLLRAFAIELADAQIELEKIEKNGSLTTAKEEAIYNNFGVLVNLTKKSNWDYNKYRNLVSGVMSSLLNGPTPQSIVSAVKLFTNFDVKIHELYKDNQLIDNSSLIGVNPQFTFIVEIEKDIGESYDQDDIIQDSNYVINIIKPAHTIHLTIITLVSKENYREQYATTHGKDAYGNNITFENSDKSIIESECITPEGIYGWKYLDYQGQFTTYKDDILTNDSLTNGGIFLGPRYVLYDNSIPYIENTSIEQYKDYCLQKSNNSRNNVGEEHVKYLQPFPSVNYKEEKPITEIKNSLVENSLKENQFGVDLINSFATYSGKIYNNSTKDSILASIKTLNNFRIGLTINVSGFLNSTLERSVNDIQDTKFIYIDNVRTDRDKKEAIDMDTSELTYKQKVINSSQTTDRLIEKYEIFIDTYKEQLNRAKQLDKINSELISDIFDAYDCKLIGYDDYSDESFYKTDDYKDISNNDKKDKLDLEMNEYFREFYLGPEEYHTHKKIVAEIKTGYPFIMVPTTDLFKISTGTNESLTKVYVNGILAPTWTYEEIPSQIDPIRGVGIQFSSSTTVPGDIVNLIYLKDRSISLGSFPITDERTIETSSSYIEGYVTKNILNKQTEMGYDYYDVFQKNKLTDSYTSNANYQTQYETFNKPQTIYNLNQEQNELINWNHTGELINPIYLNSVVLNNSIFSPVAAIIQDSTPAFNNQLSEIYNKTITDTVTMVAN